LLRIKLEKDRIHLDEIKEEIYQNYKKDKQTYSLEALETILSEAKIEVIIASEGINDKILKTSSIEKLGGFYRLMSNQYEECEKKINKVEK